MHLLKYNKLILIILLSSIIGCRGEDGAIGPAGENGMNGLNSLVNISSEAAGSNCENGGVKVDVGIDTNANGSLDADEIQSTSYICNGLDGNIGLTSVTSEPAGANCENGGLKIESGFDNNGNGTLDVDEIVSAAYICNGIDGQISLVNISDEAAGPNCSNGGIMIESGIDHNGNGTLDSDEIDVTRFICNGIDGGFDEQIRLAINFNANSSSSTPVTGGELINFNKNFFNGVDSIVFATNPYVGDASNNALVELYNLTDDVVILNSLISSNQLFADRVFLNTGNLFNDLPQTEVTLGIRFSSEINGQFAASGTPYLFLYRSN